MSTRHRLQKTKIIATIGPACDDEATLRSMMAAGMNVARLNLSHGTFDDHAERIARVRRVAEEAGVNLAIMVDTRGREIRTGKIDVLMVALNFVDRHTYDFETKVLPAAREHNMGIACMKVYGGMKGGFGSASGPNPGPMIQSKMKQLAVRYALGLPGAASCVIGPHTVEQVRENARLVRAYQPLSREKYALLMDEGKRLADAWRDHFGPVV